MRDQIFERPAPEAALVDLQPVARLKAGWALVKPHYGPLFLVACLAAAFHGLIGKLPMAGLWGAIIDVYVSAGVACYLLIAIAGGQPTFDDLLAPLKRRGVELLVVALLHALAITLGFILLVIPGLYLIVALVLAMPLTAFTTLDPVSALKRSQRIVHARFADWAVFLLGIGVANLVGALALGVGLLISIPASAGALALVTAEVLGVKRAERPAPPATMTAANG